MYRLFKLGDAANGRAIITITAEAWAQLQAISGLQNTDQADLTPLREMFDAGNAAVDEAEASIVALQAFVSAFTVE